MSSTSFDEYLNAGTTCTKFAKMGKIPGRPVTPKVNKGQNTFSTWERVKLIAKINFFYPLIEWKDGHSACVELVEYILFDYLHDAFEVRIKKL